MLGWIVTTLNKTVDEELHGLPFELRAKFSRVADLIEKFGPRDVGMPHLRPLAGKLWEIRVQAKDAIGRGIYVAVKDKKVVVLRVFVKKTNKTPEQELQLAVRRAKEAGLL
jgi:phage-related protein